MTKNTKNTTKAQPTDQNDSPDMDALKEQVEQMKEMSGKVIKRLPLLGPITWLYMNSSFHKHIFTNDLEWLVMPPLVLNQCKLYVKGDAPIAYVSWALVSESVEERLKSGNNRLAPADWKSGDRLWLIDIAAPFGAVNDVIEDLKENVFPGKEINLIGKDENGVNQAQKL